MSTSCASPCPASSTALRGKESAMRRLGSTALTTLLAAPGRAVDEGGRI